MMGREGSEGRREEEEKKKEDERRRKEEEKEEEKEDGTKVLRLSLFFSFLLHATGIC